MIRAVPAGSADIQTSSSAPGGQPNLQRLLDAAGRDTKKRFLVAGVTRDISSDGIVHVVPLANMRHSSMPTITAADLVPGRFPDNEVATALLHLEHVSAVKLVPILLQRSRPSAGDS